VLCHAPPHLPHDASNLSIWATNILALVGSLGGAEHARAFGTRRVGAPGQAIKRQPPFTPVIRGLMGLGQALGDGRFGLWRAPGAAYSSNQKTRHVPLSGLPPYPHLQHSWAPFVHGHCVCSLLFQDLWAASTNTATSLRYTPVGAAAYGGAGGKQASLHPTAPPPPPPPPLSRLDGAHTQ